MEHPLVVLSLLGPPKHEELEKWEKMDAQLIAEVVFNWATLCWWPIGVLFVDLVATALTAYPLGEPILSAELHNEIGSNSKIESRIEAQLEKSVIFSLPDLTLVLGLDKLIHVGPSKPIEAISGDLLNKKVTNMDTKPMSTI